jgi:hypothetical protein
MPLSCNLGTLTSWNPVGHSRPVTGLLSLCSPVCTVNFLRHVRLYSNFFHFLCKQLSLKFLSTSKIPNINFHVFQTLLLSPSKESKWFSARFKISVNAGGFAVLSLCVALQMQDVTWLAHSDSPFRTFVAPVYILRPSPKNLPFFPLLD